MKTQVYNWRVSSELKSDLEREARLRQAPVSVLLEEAVIAWLNRTGDQSEEQEQQKLHQAAGECIGTISSAGKNRSENTRKLVRDRLRSRNGR